MTDQYAVIGHPVEHSRSPAIHAAFAAQTGQALQYTRLPAAPDAFSDVARRFFADGGHGLNVTLPFKQEAATLADRLSERAGLAGAVNTLTRAGDGQLAGDNTDGIGLLRDLRDNLQLQLAGKRILILGAGGAVRGIVAPLLAADPVTLVVANRTLAKAEAIADLFVKHGTISACTLDAVARHEPFDVVINAISAGLSGTMPTLPATLFAADAAACDLIYADRPTPFLAWAASLGVSTRRDGFGMLVEQAAESFHVWRGIRPQTQPIITQLR